ncbi:kinase [Kitasatospora cystarginea]
MTGNPETVLMVVRGPSGAGKSSVPARLRTAYGRGIAVVAQDVLRRTVLRERDVVGGANISLIDLVARHALDHGFHVVIEGVLAAERYGPMLSRLTADHRGRSHLYYLDVDFTETVRRHATRPQAAEFSPEDMAAWYQPRDLLPDGLEHVIGQHSALDETVERILADSVLTPPGWTPRP